jgi:hypothetical protein
LAVVIAVAVLFVIPEWDLLSLNLIASINLSSPKSPNLFPINDIRVAYELSTIRYTDYSAKALGPHPGFPSYKKVC